VQLFCSLRPPPVPLLATGCSHQPGTTDKQKKYIFHPGHKEKPSADDELMAVLKNK